MRDLRSLNHMYQFSLNLFLRLFKHALEAPAAPGDIQVRERSSRLVSRVGLVRRENIPALTASDWPDGCSLP
eukprot:1160742-Prorocentrum_minimum.AAC.2